MLKEELSAKKTLSAKQGKFVFCSLLDVADRLKISLEKLPFSIRILLENLLRLSEKGLVGQKELLGLSTGSLQTEIPFMPGRILLQDFTGVPVVADLAAMRQTMKQLGHDPKKINPIIPVDLVIDHSLQVDVWAARDAFARNTQIEFERNKERYAFLRWAQKSFANFTVVPPGTGIVHQVNLEYLARVVQTKKVNGELIAFPDSVLGTDSHTTMINGLGVFGWGVGGIEAEACMLGQPYYMLVPQVVGCKLTGELPVGTTATDLVLTITQILRKKGVVGKFVEFFGPGLSTLSLPDRATLANMAPEYGATMGFFPVDKETLDFLRLTGRDEAQVDLVERYNKEQGLFRSEATPDPQFRDTIELDLSTIEPSLAGPKRPHDLVALKNVKESFNKVAPSQKREVPIEINGQKATLTDGSVIIASITSCTNTSNPTVMLAAGLLAKKAVEQGLKVNPCVKTSLAPGSQAVTEYLKKAGLLSYLEALGFHLVGYGCATCIGNSGPLLEPIAKAIKEHGLVATAVLSGNRNFEGRIHPQAKANFLASPPLVVAYALVGTVNWDPISDPLGKDKNGRAVYLKDIWPKEDEVREAASKYIHSSMFKKSYGDVFKGDEAWRNLSASEGELYHWEEKSSYIKEPPFFSAKDRGMDLTPKPVDNIREARALAVLGDSVTTDHISPAGSIPADGPAGKYLISLGVSPKDFNSFGSRRGNHEVMTRGTFANIRIKNLLLPETEGGWTLHWPSKDKLPIFEAAMRYTQEETPLIILGGKEYGSGSSRDWAAKGPALLGVRAVIAESFERIHRSNLVGMGVLPLEFLPGENRGKLGLDGRELYAIVGLPQNLMPKNTLTVHAQKDTGSTITFQTLLRLDSSIEVEYYRHGGILPFVLRQFLKTS